MSNKNMELVEFFNIHQDLGDNDLILDVRRPDEFSQAHIPEARNIPVDEVLSYVDELKKYDQIYVHCKRGGRAKTACDILAHAGLNNLVCIFDGGMDQWMEHGYPIA